MTQIPFLCLGKTLRSSYSTPVSQQLEDISIRVCYAGINHPKVLDILHWKNTFDTLLEDEFKNLRNLNIFIGGQSGHGVDKVVEMLENSAYVERLRARRNLVVDVRGKHGVLLFIIFWFPEGLFPPTPAYKVHSFATDVRWNVFDWRQWE